MVNQQFIVDKLKLSDVNNSGRLIIPKFQRGIVWTLKHRKEFLQTVRMGDPFGVVLVSQETSDKPYILIDGLQRLSTLRAYMDNPVDFIDEIDPAFDHDLLTDLIKTAYEARGLREPTPEKLKKDDKKVCKTLTLYLKKQPKLPTDTEVWPIISPELKIDTDNKRYFEVYTKFSAFYDKFKKALQLPDVDIPAIVYHGPRERLPTVFENLNTTSVALTKYEIYSSQWPDLQLLFNDQAIISAVWAKYDNLRKNSNFEIEVTEDDIKTKGITLFEYCYAVSAILNDENRAFSFLFSKEKKSTDPLGFDILSLICGLAVNKAEKLCDEEILGGVKVTSFFLTELKDDLLKSITVVQEVLSPWMHDVSGNVIKNTNMYQIYHMITMVFRHMFKLNLTDKSITVSDDAEDKQWVANFRKYAHKWYLYHRITDFWSAHRQVADLSNLIECKEESSDNIYVKDISNDMWDTAIDGFIQNKKDTNGARSIDSDSKLFMNYYYQLIFEEDRNLTKVFERVDEDGKKIIYDIEHIVAVDLFEQNGSDSPVSAIGNLCYLPPKDNRSKGCKTLYEYADERPSLKVNEELTSAINYPSREDLQFIHCSLEEFDQKYKTMYEGREKTIKSDLIRLINNNGAQPQPNSGTESNQ